MPAKSQSSRKVGRKSYSMVSFGIRDSAPAYDGKIGTDALDHALCHILLWGKREAVEWLQLNCLDMEVVGRLQNTNDW